MSSSPDVSSYVDLTIYDEDPVVILNDILSSARGLLPGWQPEAGQIEVVLQRRSLTVRLSLQRRSTVFLQPLLKFCFSYLV